MENHKNLLLKLSKLFPSSLISCHSDTLPDVAHSPSLIPIIKKAPHPSPHPQSQKDPNIVKNCSEAPNKHLRRTRHCSDVEGRKYPQRTLNKSLRNQSSSSHSGRWFTSGDETSSSSGMESDLAATRLYYESGRRRRNCRRNRRRCSSGIAVEKRSSDPYRDFMASMVEMIIDRQMFRAEELDTLLFCFLSLNTTVHSRRSRRPLLLQAAVKVCPQSRTDRPWSCPGVSQTAQLMQSRTAAPRARHTSPSNVRLRSSPLPRSDSVQELRAEISRATVRKQSRSVALHEPEVLGTSREHPPAYPSVPVNCTRPMQRRRSPASMPNSSRSRQTRASAPPLGPSDQPRPELSPAQIRLDPVQTGLDRFSLGSILRLGTLAGERRRCTGRVQLTCTLGHAGGCARVVPRTSGACTSGTPTPVRTGTQADDAGVHGTSPRQTRTRHVQLGLGVDRLRMVAHDISVRRSSHVAGRGLPGSWGYGTALHELCGLGHGWAWPGERLRANSGGGLRWRWAAAPAAVDGG
ncbi:ovate family protein 7 [Striga asiatica]|uniref:Ovate family protein 7 n=1 Tax=Striga asiatica TaxID=4170 RepID=A0A5A7PYU9_STRAF|nr:ovate family protein 7 [Striga asiatica]